MKRKFAFAIIVIIFFVFFAIYNNRTKYENNNVVFTDDFFTGVESAYVTMYGLDPFDEIKGKRLDELCQNLSAVELREKDESMYLLDGEILYGGPFKLVFTYCNGDSVALEFRENMFCFIDSSDNKNILLEQTYETVDENIEELILSYFKILRTKNE